MGSFLEDLWLSVFTPGPTPTLLVAANVTFAALQIVLFALLLATYSIHFIVLSVLSAALWTSINWFAGELQRAQAEEDARKEKEDKKAHADGKPRRIAPSEGKGGPDSSASDTETESAVEENNKTKKKEKEEGTAAAAAATAAASAFLQPPETPAGSRKRGSVSAESSGYGSTDSEWEKVDEGHTS